MMRTYESPHHSVVGLHLAHSTPTFVESGPRPFNGPCEDAIFEIGSITKVFTAILLCVLIEDGRIDPKAPLRDLSDDLADVPDWITPERLTSHTNGLPNVYVPLWKVLIRPQPVGPYADFSRADLLDWLHQRRGKRPRSRHRHAYSNLGVGLLGEAMAMMEGKPFVDLLREKVIGPLGLQDTTDKLKDDQKARLAHPRATSGKPVPPWTFQSLAAAGCLRSTARDLTRFAAHVIRPSRRRTRSSIAPSAALPFRSLAWGSEVRGYPWHNARAGCRWRWIGPRPDTSFTTAGLQGPPVLSMSAPKRQPHWPFCRTTVWPQTYGQVRSWVGQTSCGWRMIISRRTDCWSPKSLMTNGLPGPSLA